jgi:iron complex transport system substrate-binding protein
VSCVNHKSEVEEENVQERPEIELEVKYAEGFEIDYQNKQTKLVSKSLNKNSFFRDSIFILHQKGDKQSKSHKVVAEVSSISCQSSTHLAYIDYLNDFDKVKGLCGVDFVQNQELKRQMDENEVVELCLGESIQLESLIGTNPDLFFVYPFAKEEVENLESKGVNTFMVSEYLEKSPLARLEWIKLFGVILNKEEEAQSYFEDVEEEYLGLVKEEVDSNMKFMFNLPFGDTWYTPSSNSLIVKLFEDAGLSYFYSSEVGTENTPHTQEEVWNNGPLVNYWVIIASRPANFTLADLVEENEVYSTFKSVINEQVIFCNTTTTDYFIEGVIEPHIMLKDILYASHQITEHQPKYFHLLK